MTDDSTLFFFFSTQKLQSPWAKWNKSLHELPSNIYTYICLQIGVLSWHKLYEIKQTH